MVYDFDNNEVNLIDAMGNKTTFSFDALNRETAMTDPAARRQPMPLMPATGKPRLRTGMAG